MGTAVGLPNDLPSALEALNLSATPHPWSPQQEAKGAV